MPYTQDNPGTCELDGVTFVYHGGPYINVYWRDAYALRPDDAVPFTCIGVWDYPGGRSTVTSEAEFQAQCAEWIEDNRGDMGGLLEASM